MNQEPLHKPVLLDEAVSSLLTDPAGVYIDGTFGRGGHSREILSRLNVNGKLIVLDRDQNSIELAKKEFNDDERIKPYHAAFAGMKTITSELGLLGKVTGILMDLGLSSYQLESRERGFSFTQDDFLDMRMNKQEGITASEWLNSADEKEIRFVLKEYGEERFAGKVAKEIVLTRDDQPIETTKQLADICQKVIWKKGRKHPATKVFLAIRIWINDELQQLKDALEQSVEILAKGGRLVVISFHSLEDRIVKQFMRKLSSIDLPPKLPIISDEKPIFKLVGKALKPSLVEIDNNKRARSAILRVAEKTL